jgi:hypothetical protein
MRIAFELLWEGGSFFEATVQLPEGCKDARVTWDPGNRKLFFHGNGAREDFTVPEPPWIPPPDLRT